MEVIENPLIEASVVNGIKESLVAKGETLSVAESVTSGLLQVAISQALEASKFFQGGITAYNLGQKYKHLNVDPVHAQNCNCISGEVARQMALNTCTLFRSDWGIGVTGYAAHDPKDEADLFAHYAVAHRGEIVKEDKLNAPDTEPYEVQLFYVRNILEALRGLV